MDSFVVLDVETTGLDPGQDAIIQVALLRVSPGAVDRLSFFVNPEGPIPEHVLRLTGFSDIDFDAYPPMSARRREIADFIGTLPVVGHNVGFDVAFLARYGVTVESTVDTLEWARIAFPGRPGYRLEDLAQAGGSGFHDARVDVDATLSLIYAIRDALAGFPSAVRRDLARILGPEWAWWHVPDQPDDTLSPLDRPAAEPAPAQPERIAVEGDAAWWLSLDGPLAGAMERFELRDGQRAMLEAVEQNFHERRILLAEAGTGTGKSLAYLLPAALAAARTASRVVVATHTVALQEQLWTKDLPQATRDLPIKTALVKGKGRYVCLLKANDVRQAVSSLSDPRDVRMAVARLLTFIAATDRGDYDAFNPRGEAARQLWNQVAADRLACAGPKCAYAGPCFMRSARRDAESAHLVIVNHALLAAHLAQGNVLPEFSHVIVDEAHHFGQVVEHAFGFTLDLEEFVQMFRDFDAARQGLFDRLSAHPDLRPALESSRVAMRRALPGLEELSRRLAADTPHSGYARQSVRVTSARWTQWEEGGQAAQLGEVAAALALALDRARDVWAEAEAIYGQALRDDALWLRFEKWLEDLTEAATGVARWAVPDPQWVSWWDRVHRAGRTGVTLRRAPVEVGGLIRETLWDRVASGVLTSATLSVNGDFSYVANALGLDPDRVQTVRLKTPFDVRKQARLVVPDDLSDVTDPRFEEQVADFLLNTVPALGGRTLVLLTSYRMLTAVADRLREPFARQHIALLAQGADGTPQKLVQQFRSDPRAVLMGTASLWEGVDIPGSGLSMVVVTRLPFASPGDPLEDARQERLRASGQSPFYLRSLPEAILRFQQGFGRLLRTNQDRGVVAVLDRRILPGATRYGARFIEALPGPTVVIGSQRQVVEGIVDFFKTAPPDGETWPETDG